MNDMITDYANEALCAVAAVQVYCFDNDLNLQVYALNSAQNDIDSIKQIIENRGEVIALSELRAFCDYYQKYGEGFDAVEFMRLLAEVEGEDYVI